MTICPSCHSALELIDEINAFICTGCGYVHSESQIHFEEPIVSQTTKRPRLEPSQPKRRTLFSLLAHAERILALYSSADAIDRIDFLLKSYVADEKPTHGKFGQAITAALCFHVLKTRSKVSSLESFALNIGVEFTELGRAYCFAKRCLDLKDDYNVDVLMDNACSSLARQRNKTLKETAKIVFDYANTQGLEIGRKLDGLILACVWIARDALEGNKLKHTDLNKSADDFNVHAGNAKKRYMELKKLFEKSYRSLPWALKETFRETMYIDVIRNYKDLAAQGAPAFTRAEEARERRNLQVERLKENSPVCKEEEIVKSLLLMGVDKDKILSATSGNALKNLLEASKKVIVQSSDELPGADIDEADIDQYLNDPQFVNFLNTIKRV